MIRTLHLLSIALLLSCSAAWSQCSFSVTTAVTNVNCYNGTTGAVTVNVSGGTAPYQYQLAEAGAGAWQTSNTFTSLIANNYPVSVKDATGCVKTVYFTVSQPANLATTYTATDATCTGANNGTLTTSTTGGTAPYSYAWTKDGVAYATTPNLTDLVPANYLLTVTDSKGCMTIPVVSSEVKPISLTGFNQDVIANGTGAPTLSTTQPLDDHNYVYYANGYKISTTAGAGGLPASGSFTSAQNATRTYQLNPYTSNNALVLSSAASYGSSVSGTLAFTPAYQGPYSTLYIVGTTGNGTGTVNYTVKFSDASTLTGALTLPDWFLDPGTASTQRALGGLDRVSWAASGAAYAASTSFNLFESPINIPTASQGKAITGVTFAWAGSSSARINIFAITGNTSATTGIRINDGPAATVTPSVAVTSTAPSGVFCTGQQVTFTANPVNGGTAPTYQWYKNNVAVSGATGITYSPGALSSNDNIHVVLTSSLACVTASTATAAKLTMVTGTVPASVSITSTGSSVCSGSPVTFTANPVNGGTSPTYQWYKNNVAISGATGSTYTSSSFIDGDQVKVIATSSISCATGNPATSNVMPVTVSVSAEPSVTLSVVPGFTFTATPSYGGPSPTYEWYKNGVLISGAAGPVYQTINLASSDVYTVKLISNYACRTTFAAMSNTAGVSSMMLPVRLEFFQVSAQEKTVVMKWTTSYEQNNKQFLIQRSSAGGSFTTVGAMQATNNSAGSTYRYDDRPAIGGTYQYRLVQQDIDGALHFFDIRSVTLRDGSLSIYDQGHSWSVTSVKGMMFELMDIEGRLLQKRMFSGTTVITKPPVKGLYLVRFTNGNDSFTKKLIAR